MAAANARARATENAVCFIEASLAGLNCAVARGQSTPRRQAMSQSRSVCAMMRLVGWASRNSGEGKARQRTQRRNEVADPRRAHAVCIKEMVGEPPQRRGTA